MALKKSELYASLWEAATSCAEAWTRRSKGYILVLLFMKYVSGKAALQR